MGKLTVLAFLLDVCTAIFLEKNPDAETKKSSSLLSDRHGYTNESLDIVQGHQRDGIEFLDMEYLRELGVQPHVLPPAEQIVFPFIELMEYTAAEVVMHPPIQKNEVQTFAELRHRLKDQFLSTHPDADHDEQDLIWPGFLLKSYRRTPEEIMEDMHIFIQFADTMEVGQYADYLRQVALIAAYSPEFDAWF